MKYLTFILVLFSFTTNVSGQTFEFSTKKVQKDYYVALTSLTESPVHWLDEPEGKVKGTAHRICIATSEIYNSLYIERVTLGQVGCCKSIVESRELDLFQVFEKFGLTGEISGITFNQWIDSSSCDIMIGEKSYRLSQLEKEKIKVSLIN